MFEFANQWAFWLLPLPLLAYWLLPPVHWRAEALMVPFIKQAAEATGDKLRKRAWISKRNLLQWIMLLLVWIAFIIAFARPQIVGKPEMKVKTARSFVIAADISFSMANRDWVVEGERYTRWEGVKQVLGDFIKTRDGDRLALIFFGTNAYVQTPLTTELGVVSWFLDETDVGMAGQMTSVGKAIGMSMNLFEQDTIENKVMLLLTDGQDGGKGITPIDAAYLAKSDSIKIYTLGIGDPTASGSDLDEVTLKKISQITGGKYFQAMDQKQLKQVSTELDALEPMEFEEEDYKPITHLYFYPLIIAIMLSFLLLAIRIVSSLFKRE
ncbi:VWA domain-containing protein [Carboxylicivirga sp. M1479]|uniref:vWA domain-containing protein n=1 Tax=Carboxylicivirga sp. M1479 TaxID=2594476 RepID=UPI0011774956|nr:VWA domain-containing protein [Carboxylicivirga sp. M1479]TRX72118.1 VWA domain-containing protein [Carboxylicivirga sp. M1479]